jgi:Virulence factor BrkB
MASAHTDAETCAPDPDDPRKPDSPTDLTGSSRSYVLRKTAREFTQDQCMDLAAALTYYAVMSLFPALLVVVSLLGVFGRGRSTTEAVLGIADDLLPAQVVDTLREPIGQLVQSPTAGLALMVGVAGALGHESVIGDLTRRPVAFDSHGGLGQQRQSGRFTHGGSASRRREGHTPAQNGSCRLARSARGYSFDATSMVPRGNSTSRRSDAREL